MSWFSGGWFKNHIGTVVGSLLAPGFGSWLGHTYDKQQNSYNSLLKQSNQNQQVANALTYKQYQAQVDANNEARAQALENRKNTIDAQRKQILGNQRKSYGSGNAISSGNGFSLLDNNKTLG